MKYKYFALVTLIVALGFVVLYSPVASQPDGQEVLATASDTVLAHDQISWTPDIAYEGASLVIGGQDDFFVEAAFAAGEPLAYNIAGLADGGYTFEWRLEPVVDAAVMEELTALDSETRGQRVAELQAAGVLPQLDQVVQAGYFTISGGALVLDSPEAGSADEAASDTVTPADQVINDDLIVQFSGCFGNDCVNGENFGFDTLRLKENNLRIHFNDTSNSASFPSTDWRITINDTSNGGQNYFAIEDATAGRIPFRVEGGAPANTLYVESDGDVGIKTANPVVDVHIVEGNTPTVRLEQDGSDGFSAQTFDMAGNEANFFIRDVTNGSRLFFRAKPGAPQDSLFIAADGDIGLGTDSPQGELHVTGPNNSSMIFNGGNLTLSGILLEASDKNLKENFTAVDSQTVLAQIVQMPITMWNYISDDNDTVHMGPMAQDFYAAFGLGTDDKHIAPLDANGVAFAGIKGLFELFQTHDAELEALEQENEDLKARVEDLEAAVDALLKAQEAQGE